MAEKREHRKPDVPREAREAERVANHMYGSLKLKTAPKASGRGYVMGAAAVLKMMIEQASAQGDDREELKALAARFFMDI